MASPPSLPSPLPLVHLERPTNGSDRRRRYAGGFPRQYECESIRAARDPRRQLSSLRAGGVWAQEIELHRADPPRVGDRHPRITLTPLDDASARIEAERLVRVIGHTHRDLS